MELSQNQLDILQRCAKDDAAFQKILETIGAVPKAKYKVLVVDDHTAICALVKGAVEMEDCEATTVNTGQAAVDAIQRQKWDLVFLDIILPDIDGGVILNRIRDSELNKDTPVVFITGLIKPEEESNLVPRNEKYLGKPFTIEKLRLTTREVLKIV